MSQVHIGPGLVSMSPAKLSSSSVVMVSRAIAMKLRSRVCHVWCTTFPAGFGQSDCRLARSQGRRTKKAVG